MATYDFSTWEIIRLRLQSLPYWQGVPGETSTMYVLLTSDHQ